MLAKSQECTPRGEMEDNGPPAGPDGSQKEDHDEENAGLRKGVPNLCDLVGTLSVTVVTVRNIPLVPATSIHHDEAASSAEPGAGENEVASHADATRSPRTKKDPSAPGRRGSKGVRGMPFLKIQMGMHQFQTIEPAVKAPREDVIDDSEPELEWGETLRFELSGDMRELRLALLNWERPLALGPQGVVRIPIGELVNSKWADAIRNMTKVMVTGENEKFLMSADNQYTTVEIRVAYDPGSSMSFSGKIDAGREGRVLRSGCRITCEMCRRQVFVTSRPTPSLVKKAIKEKSQRKVLLWLRDYSFHHALDVKKLEVPRSLFSLPAFIFGPEPKVSTPVRDFVSVLMEDQELNDRLKAMRILNHKPKLNSWTPLYCSPDGSCDALLDAVGIAVWGMQEMAGRLSLEIQAEFREKHDKYLHLWVKAHYIRFPACKEHEAQGAWEKIKQEIEENAFFKPETTYIRLLVLANVLNRPLVVHSDEPLPENELSPRKNVSQKDPEEDHKIKVFGATGPQAPVPETMPEPMPVLFRGIYLPLLHPKPLLLESNRHQYRPPVPLVRPVFLRKGS